MQQVEFADSGGDTISLVEFPNGLLMESCFENTDLDVVSSFPMRDDDVIICSYPRAGVHWLCEQVRMILAGKTDLEDNVDKEVEMLEFHFQSDINQLPSPRILNSHFTLELLPVDVLKKRTKLILLYRNPKDVAVSFYHFHVSYPNYQYSGKFGNWLKLFKEGHVNYGTYGDYLKDWERVIQQHPELPIHLISYEKLKEIPIEELRRLSGFLDRDVNDDFLRAVTEACSISKQRARKAKFWKSMDYEDNEKVLYRKGESGEWKNWFTVAQNEQFDLYWTKVMAGSKFLSLIK